MFQPESSRQSNSTLPGKIIGNQTVHCLEIVGNQTVHCLEIVGNQTVHCLKNSRMKNKNTIASLRIK